MVSKDVVKDECIKRMKNLKLAAKVIDEFRSNDKIYISDVANNNLKETTACSSFQLDICEFERAYNVKIYHIIHTESNNIDETHLLYVSQKKEEWRSERKDISKGFIETFYYKEIKGKKVIGVSVEKGRIIKIV